MHDRVVWPRRLAVGAIIAGVLGCSEPDLGVPPQVCSTEAVNVGESELMEPGGTCIHCHSSYDGPSFALAGTVMNGLHDDTNCADGMRVELVTNGNGNFRLDHWPGTNLYPYIAEISRNGVVGKMMTPRQPGENDCNSCHTPAGLSAAPGRIVAP